MDLVGFDIGGTKCTVILGALDGNDGITIVDKQVILTSRYPAPGEMIPRMQGAMEDILRKHGIDRSSVGSIGISCGGPLDSRRGVILSPPNLPGWDNVHIVDDLYSLYGIRTGLQNDANACALAEWKFGAGRGFSNLVFLTFGTGMGAGLILNGTLYEGTNDNAGEVGHIRLEDDGPVGYGKAGSFEGFCSGGGIMQLARTMAAEALKLNRKSLLFNNPGDIDKITTLGVAESANAGDALAKEIFQVCGRYLGRGLSVLIDILNPEIIILGSIYVRAAALLQPALSESLEREALSLSRKVCRIVPAGLGESIGDYAALSVAANFLKKK
ncbi:MAG TPA: ROK family protein [Bacteroidales bacterium]|nr:ROK family protein [Bacteroidales bacterium]